MVSDFVEWCPVLNVTHDALEHHLAPVTTITAIEGQLACRRPAVYDCPACKLRTCDVQRAEFRKLPTVLITTIPSSELDHDHSAPCATPSPKKVRSYVTMSLQVSHLYPHAGNLK
jgi:hypothetical protein